LHFILRKVLHDDARVYLVRQLFNQLLAAFLIVCILVTAILLPLCVVNVFHISPICHISTYGTLTTRFGANDKHDLWNDGLSCGLINIINLTGRINASHLSNLIIVINNWNGIVKEVLHSLFDHVGIVIHSITVFGALHASFLHQCLRNVVINDQLRFAHTLLKELCLVNGTWEPVNQITLYEERIEHGEQISFLNFEIGIEILIQIL
jgi:hypothetical protein